MDAFQAFDGGSIPPERRTLLLMVKFCLKQIECVDRIQELERQIKELELEKKLRQLKDELNVPRSGVNMSTYSLLSSVPGEKLDHSLETQIVDLLIDIQNEQSDMRKNVEQLMKNNTKMESVVNDKVIPLEIQVFNEIVSRIDGIKEQLVQMSEKMEDLEEKMESFDEHSGGNDEALTTKIEALQGDTKGISESLASLSSSIQSCSTKIDELKSETETISFAIEKLEGAQTGIMKKLEFFESRSDLFDGIKTNMEEIKENEKKTEETIGKLAEDVNSMKGKVEELVEKSEKSSVSVVTVVEKLNKLTENAKSDPNLKIEQIPQTPTMVEIGEEQKETVRRLTKEIETMEKEKKEAEKKKKEKYDKKIKEAEQKQIRALQGDDEEKDLERRLQALMTGHLSSVKDKVSIVDGKVKNSNGTLMNFAVFSRMIQTRPWTVLPEITKEDMAK